MSDDATIEHGPLRSRAYHTQFINGKLVVGDWDHRNLIERFNKLNINPGDTVLDAGCRDGFFSQYFARRGGVVTAMDIADTVYRQELQAEVGFEFVRMNILELPEQDRKWDVVFCSDVLCHMRDPLGGLLALRHACAREAYFVTDGRESLGRCCIVQPGAIRDKKAFYPFVWAPAFFRQMLQWAGFRAVERIDQMVMRGNVYAPRKVFLFKAIPGEARVKDISDILEWKKYKKENGL